MKDFIFLFFALLINTESFAGKFKGEFPAVNPKASREPKPAKQPERDEIPYPVYTHRPGKETSGGYSGGRVASAATESALYRTFSPLHFDAPQNFEDIIEERKFYEEKSRKIKEASEKAERDAL